MALALRALDTLAQAYLANAVARPQKKFTEVFRWWLIGSEFNRLRRATKLSFFCRQFVGPKN